MANNATGALGWTIAAILGIALIGRCSGHASDAVTSPNGALGGRETAGVEKTLYVRAARLNCRRGATTKSRAVESLPDRLMVGVVREENQWSLLDRRDPCWVRSSYLGSSARPPEPVRAFVSAPTSSRRSSPARRASSGGAFANCSAARAAGAAPVYRGDPGYARRLDRDGDGVGCE